MTAMITLKEKIGYGLGDMASSMFWKLFGRKKNTSFCHIFLVINVYAKILSFYNV